MFAKNCNIHEISDFGKNDWTLEQDIQCRIVLRINT